MTKDGLSKYDSSTMANAISARQREGHKNYNKKTGDSVEFLDNVQDCFSRDELLQVAEYLNSFQSFYLKEGTSLGTISFLDLRSILNHHRRVEQKLQQQNFENGDESSLQVDVDSIEDDKDAIDDDPPELDIRLKSIDQLWTRVNAWNAAALAQQFLITPSTVADKFHQQTKSSSRAATRQRSKATEDDDDDDDDDDYDDDDSLEGERHHKQQPEGIEKKQAVASSFEELVFAKSHLFFSTVLNLPLSSYVEAIRPETKEDRNPGLVNLPSFAQIFDLTYNNNKNIITGGGGESTKGYTHEIDSLRLSLPPNHYTWQFYASITSLLVQLPSSLLTSVYTSPFLGNMHMGFGLNRRPKALPRSLTTAGQPSKFRKADLVALFIRAQRNLEAKRHFIQLFEYVPRNGGGTEFIKAIFRGNHKHIHTRSIRSSPGLQHLQSWALSNQVLRTAPLVRKFIKQKYPFSGDHRRPRPPLEYSNATLNKRKRMRLGKDNEQSSTEWPENKMLVQAVYAALLRSWARQYQRHLAPLFCSSSEQVFALNRAGFFPLRESTDETQGHVVWTKEAIQIVLQNVKESLATTDRNLARIDRRICFGKYEDPRVFEETVKGVVDKFISVVKDHAPGVIDVEVLTTCLEEHLFEPLRAFETLKSEVGPLRAAARLIVLDEGKCDNDSAASDLFVRKIYESVPPPWVSECRKCKKRLLAIDGKKGSAAIEASGGDASILRCISCHSTYHADCGAQPLVQSQDGMDDGEAERCQAMTKKLRSYIDAFSPLDQLFTVRVPSDSTVDIQGRPVVVPNYGDESMKDQIEWAEEQVNIKRKIVDNDGQYLLEPYGMGLSHLSLCEDTMRSLLSGEQHVWDIPSWGGSVALSVCYKEGLLVNSIRSGGVAETAGLKKNDIVWAVEFVHFQTDEEDVKFSASREA